MSEALRSLLASFVVEVDKAGDLAKGNAQVDALKQKLSDLQASFDKVKAPAARAAGAVSDVFARAGQAAQRNMQAIAASQLGGGGGAGGFAAAGAARASRLQALLGLGGRGDNGGFGAAGASTGGSIGAQVGPTRDTLNAGRAQMRAAEQAAAAYAQTLRGKLAGAVNAVRAGFSGGSGSGAQGPGLITTLATVRNGMLALGAGAVAHGVKSLVDGIGDISEGAARLGVTTDEFQRMSAWAKQNATDVDTLGTAFRTLAISAVDPTKETAQAFADLGVKTTDAAGQFKTSQQLFLEVGEALSGVTNETVRSQLAQKLLGRSAMALKPMFAQGTEAFKRQREEMLKLKVLSPEVIKAADDLSDSWVVLSAQLLATAGPVLQNVLFPALKTLTGFLVKGVEWLGKFIAKTDFMAVGITALGYAVVTKLLPGLRLMIGLGGGVSMSLLGMGAAAAKAAASFAILALKLFIVQDLISFLSGNESTIGSVMDKLFGKGASTGVIEALGKAWDMLAASVKVVLEALHLFKPGEASLEQRSRAQEAWQGSNFQKLGERVRGGVGAELLGGVADDPFMKSLGAASGGAPSVTIGDSVVNVTMSNSATAGDVGREVSSVLDPRDRAATLASYPQ